jgi:CHASE3 domain sensor protein
MKTKSLLLRKVQLAIGSAILASLVVGAVSYRSTAESTAGDRWVRHTHEVLEKLQNLLTAEQGIESSYREFVTAGEESDLESYRASILSTEQREATVRSLTVDNPKKQAILMLRDVDAKRCVGQTKTVRGAAPAFVSSSVLFQPPERRNEYVSNLLWAWRPGCVQFEALSWNS